MAGSSTWMSVVMPMHPPEEGQGEPRVVGALCLAGVVPVVRNGLFEKGGHGVPVRFSVGERPGGVGRYGEDFPDGRQMVGRDWETCWGCFWDRVPRN